MVSIIEGLKELLELNAIPNAFFATLLLALLGLLLGLGRRLDLAIRIERLGVPIALLAGFFALLVGPYGPLPLLPQSIADIWVQLPTPLLTLVFATLMIGRPLPKAEGLVKPVASQAFLALLLGFGQYLVGGLVVLFILIPRLGVDPLMACLIEVGFEGGHGAASIMGESFSNLGFSGGLDLGLAMATVGLLSSTLLGSLFVVLGRWRGWIANQAIEVISSGDSQEENISTSIFEQIEVLVVNLALAGSAVLLGVGALAALRWVAPYLGGMYEQVILVFPVFPLALLGSLFIRWVLEKTEKTYLVSQLLQREIGALATDILITTAMASLNLPLLKNDWVPLTVLSVAGLFWNLAGMLVYAKITFRKEWFERSITEFGNATGVAASGILLLRLADPRNLTNTLPVFSIKQLFLQPLLSGGVITVIAPLAITNFGLIGWTELCGILTMLFLFSGILFQDKSPD